MARTIAEFRRNAVRFWPDEIRSQADLISVLPSLVETQEAFLSILKLADKSPTSWEDALRVTDSLSGGLFLKHLMVLSDLGGEALNKIAPLSEQFPDAQMEFEWSGETHTWQFTALGQAKTAHNNSLGVTEKKIANGDAELQPIMRDAVMLILFGGLAINSRLAPQYAEKCMIGAMLGRGNELKQFVREAYLRVSRQVNGGTANALGALMQVYVADKLRARLPGWRVQTDQPLPGVTHRIDQVGTNFDVRTIAPNGMHFGVEVSFQVTTNSTIERKAREAANVQQAVHLHDHRVCYVIDGAGNIDVREQAIQTLFDHSDMTVACSDEELTLLANYMLDQGKAKI